MTLTSLALMERQARFHSGSSRSIGLWKDGMGAAEEIECPKGCQGVAIRIASEPHEERTLDGRSDKGTARRWRLEHQVPIALTEVPDWVNKF